MPYQVELQDGRLIKRHIDHLRKKCGPSHHPSTPAGLVDSPSTAREPESVTQPEERTAPVGPNVPEGPNVDREATPTEGSPGQGDTSTNTEPEQRPVEPRRSSRLRHPPDRYY